MKALSRLLFILILLSIVSIVSSCEGNGVIRKACFYEGEIRIEGAKVWIEELDQTQYTDAEGYAAFLDIPFGTYTLYVDIDNDDIWDETTDGQLTDTIEVEEEIEYFILNIYDLPTPPTSQELNKE